MKVRILYNADRTVSVIHPAPNSKKENETEEDWLTRIFDEATPTGIEYDDIDHTALPDRSDRQYWRGDKITGIVVERP